VAVDSPDGSLTLWCVEVPEGLLHEAVTAAGREVTSRLRQAVAAGADAAMLLAGVCDYFANWLTTSDYAAGCPVAAVAQEAFADPDLRVAAAAAISDWVDLIAENPATPSC
jgi:hypothetical protein